MNAKVEELQQDALQSKKNLSYREILVEKRFKEQEKQETIFDPFSRPFK
jgi:hypothetical protein